MKRLFMLVLLVWLAAPAAAAPVVTLGPPATDSFSTVDPGSIGVVMLGAGETVDLQVSITIHPFCFRPIDISLFAPGAGGTFTDQTGVVTNDCGGNTSVFNIRLTGDGLAHAFDIEFLDIDTGSALVSIPVLLYPDAAPVVALGPPVSDSFLTVDPGSIRVEKLDAGILVDVQVSIAVHPFCFAPIDIGVAATGDGGTFTDLTGALVNQCGGHVSEFDIRLTGDGLTHAFDIAFFDLNSGTILAPVAVELFPGVADPDRDGISDLSDNCVQVANADQRDTDTDRIGNACDPDIARRNDCLVNFADLNTLKSAFFSTPAAPQWNPDADFNGDNSVNFGDLEVMKNAFFGPPGPSASGCN